MVKEKFRELMKNKTFLCCIILTLIYLSSGYCKWLEIGLPIVATFAFIFLPLQSGFCIFSFLHCFSLSNIGYESTFMATFISFSIILTIRYIIGAKKKKYKVYKNLLISIAILLIFGTLTSFFYLYYLGGFYYYCYFPIFYCIFAMRDEFDIIEAMKYFTFGFILSCSLSLLGFILPKYQYNCIQNKRFLGFMNHPNTVYIRGIMVITFWSLMQLKNETSFLKFSLIYIFTSVAILATLSKAGILLLALYTIIYLILFVKKDFKKRYVYGLIFLGLVLILGLILHKFIIQIFERYLTNGKDVLNTILTGRVDIWKDYLTECFSDPFALLFGHGLFGKEVFIHAQNMTRASHNLYIFLLYRLGIIGLIMLGVIIYFFAKTISKKKFLICEFLPLSFFLLDSLIACTFKDYNIMLLLFGLMLLFHSKKENKDKI